MPRLAPGEREGENGERACQKLSQQYCTVLTSLRGRKSCVLAPPFPFGGGGGSCSKPRAESEGDTKLSGRRAEVAEGVWRLLPIPRQLRLLEEGGWSFERTSRLL